MMKEVQKTGIYEFGEYQIDTLRMLLITRQGGAVTLPPKAFEVLQLMVESGGRVLTKDELLSEAWHGTVVEEGNLTQTVSILRKALGESRNDHRYIVTVPGYGYRFVAPVREIGINGSLIATDDRQTTDQTVTGSFAAHHEQNQKALPKRQWIVLLAACLLAALGVYAAYSLWTMPRMTTPISLAELRSIAVLPFDNVGAQPDDEYLAIGITDALITNLSKNKRVAVRPTNAVLKYNGVKPALQNVGRDLKVDALLDGRLQRLGNRIRVTVQLVRTTDGVSLWAETIDDSFTNIFSVQDSIAHKVADALTLTLSRDGTHTARRIPTNAAAYEAYLRGRFFWNKRTGTALEKSITYLEEAVRLDPDFALAHAGLAESLVLMNLYGAKYRQDAFPKAREAALRSLSLDNTLASAHTALALIKLEYDYDWPGAEDSYRKALDLNPNYATAHHWYSEYLAFVGRFEDSVKHIERAYELDPASLIINTARGYPYMRSGQCGLAIEYFKEALEMEPTFPLAHFYLGKCYVEMERFSDAIRSQSAAAATSGDSAIFLAALAYAQAAAGKLDEARAVLKRMESLLRTRYISPYSMATVYAALGNKDEAFRSLGKAYEDRDYQLPTIKHDIHFANLRDDPRFHELLERIGLRMTQN